MKKQEPAVLTMRFAPQSVTQVDTAYIDLSQCASLLNRRFYRQGINWAVAGIKILASSGDPDNRAEGYVSVTKLPETWIMANAWMKGFATWQRLNEEATDESQSIKPRFLDFKIYADATHHQQGSGANLLPSFATAGEWDYSKMVIPKTDGTDDVSTRDIIATGANYPGPGGNATTNDNAVSLIEGYAAGRALPSLADPNMPLDSKSTAVTAAENWMQATFNQGTDQSTEVIEDLILQNNIAPYPFEGGDDGAGGVHADTMYPGGANQLVGLQFHDDSYITSTTIGAHTRLKGGQFPCGLMRFDVINTTPGDLEIEYSIQVDLVPGSHRGYLCETMAEM